jgi:acyl dehydratase
MTASLFPIEAGHIMMFARAIGDFNPVYHDAELARESEVGGIIAPPTFVQANAQYDPDYPLRPHPGVPWFGSGATPSGRVFDAGSTATKEGSDGKQSGGTALHAEQHYEYHRPIRAGEVLTLTVRSGMTWEKQGRRGGLLHFQETIVEYRGEDGELAVTARGVGVRTEQAVSDQP